jgi:plastocyanin
MNQMMRSASPVRDNWWLLELGAVAIVALATATASAYAQQAQPVTVTTTEYAFNPKNVTLHIGQPVQLVIQNSGADDHNLSSEDIPISNVTYQRADNDPAELREYESNNVLDTDVKAGATSRVTFTPTRAGTFQFTSGEGDDEQKGMVGMFVVLAPATLPNTGSDPWPDTIAPASVLIGALLVAGGLALRRRAHSRSTRG